MGIWYNCSDSILKVPPWRNAKLNQHHHQKLQEIDVRTDSIMTWSRITEKIYRATPKQGCFISLCYCSNHPRIPPEQVRRLGCSGCIH